MTSSDWRSSPALGLLRDIVASDRLVLFTGAGVSFGLKQAADPTRSLPGWLDLLRALLEKLKTSMDAAALEDCTSLLEPGARSQHLIAAASILWRTNRALFDDEVRRLTTPQP